mmetsp:Transcript_78641/g.200159  ORF Transcript_78641/g.200159 Transcript_78641/m.200159 type:complete len:315 (+) Transcript_78641:1-945(+)
MREQMTILASPKGATVTKGFGLIFTKRTFVKSIIESTSLATQKKNSEPFVEFLQSRGAGRGPPRALSLGDDASTTAASSRQALPSLLSTRTISSKSLGSPKADAGRVVVEVWELQRRLTLFHTTWQAPFLPHDGEKQWRWVDKEYRTHPWAVESLEASGDSDTPALKLPWHLQQRQGGAGWEVQSTPTSDADGWAYGLDLYQSDELWFANPTWFHCRRRLWRIELQDATANGLSALECMSPRSLRRRSGARMLMAFLMMMLLLVAVLIAGWWMYSPASSSVLLLADTASAFDAAASPLAGAWCPADAPSCVLLR